MSEEQVARLLSLVRERLIPVRRACWSGTHEVSCAPAALAMEDPRALEDALRK